MNFRKILSAAVAAAVCVSMTAVTASAETIGSASIYLADETWSSQVYWGGGLDDKNTIGIASLTPAEITGDGTYTTSVEFTEEMSYGHVFCLSSDIAGTGSGANSKFAAYPDAEMSIVSVKADGSEVQGNTSVCDVNDGGFMKINILNPLVDASENYVYKSDWTLGIKSVEVTFEVKGTGISNENIAADATDETETPSVPDEQKPEGDSNTPAADNQQNEDAAGEENIPAEKPADENQTEGNTAEENTTEENTPAGDKTDIPDTGNVPMSPLAAVTALAGLIAFMTKKK